MNVGGRGWREDKEEGGLGPGRTSKGPSFGTSDSVRYGHKIFSVEVRKDLVRSDRPRIGKTIEVRTPSVRLSRVPRV